MKAAVAWVPLKANADEALLTCPSIRHVIVAKNTGGAVGMMAGRDHWWDASRRVKARPASRSR